MCSLAYNESGWIGIWCVVWFYFNVDLDSGPKEGAPLPKSCAGVSFELRRFSIPLLFSSELLLSNHFLTGELGIVVSPTIRKISLGAYPNCSCTQTTTYSSLRSDEC